MSENLLFANIDDIRVIARALDSQLRCKMLQLLYSSKMNIRQLCEELQIPQSTCTMNVQILEKANLIHTEQMPAAVHGSQKVCSLRWEKILLPLVEKAPVKNSNAIETEMPIGLFSDFRVSSPCGMLSESGIIGYYDSIESFLHPQRAGASLIWFSYGYLEYRFPKNFSSEQEVVSLSLSAELCSEYPGYNLTWPSDITLWINGIEVGTWTAPGDMGDKRGLLSPHWWSSGDTQYGFLKTWKVGKNGSTIDNKEASQICIDDLSVYDSDAIRIRLGVKETAHNRGGLNIFGLKCGNYPQDIKLIINIR